RRAGRRAPVADARGPAARVAAQRARPGARLAAGPTARRCAGPDLARPAPAGRLASGEFAILPAVAPERAAPGDLVPLPPRTLRRPAAASRAAGLRQRPRAARRDRALARVRAGAGDARQSRPRALVPAQRARGRVAAVLARKSIGGERTWTRAWNDLHALG